MNQWARRDRPFPNLGCRRVNHGASGSIYLDVLGYYIFTYRSRLSFPVLEVIRWTADVPLCLISQMPSCYNIMMCTGHSPNVPPYL